MSEILPCPFTAGGCPLFNIQPGADPVQTSCHGGCSPAPAPAAVSVSDKQTQTQTRELRAIPLVGHQRSESAPSSSSGRQHPLLPTPPTIAYDTFGEYDSISSSSTTHRSSSALASGLTDALLFGELSLPTGDDNSLEALNVGEPWNALDLAPYGVSPGQLEVPPYWSTQSAAAGSRPFATGSASAAAPSAAASSSVAAPTAKHGLWDIEELVSYEGPRAKRSRKASPPPALSAMRPKLEPIPVVMSPGSMAVGDSGPDQASQLPTPPSLSSPPSSPEETEHITPFISKLCFLLEHKEYEPWVRWDSTGQYLLVAHSKPHLLQVLEKFFRHTVISSFIRQLNIYGFRRASTSVLLTVLESTKYATSVEIPGSDEIEHFSAADYSAFVNPNFFRSTPGGPQCRLGALKPIAKERPPRSRSTGAKKSAPATRASGRRGSASSASRKRMPSASSDSEYGG
ncbi:hypothetical protein RHOSPDRAFT_31289 [Rhodotorula sp. JG-1b]|nr:hypothetical protein RHOSPDRAFT_31289 [Rhodotorula sp. JG-1b]